MKEKPTLTKTQLTQRVNEDAKAMRDRVKREGGKVSFIECKEKARIILMKEYKIV
tara:strand:+ start:295 stop:459 length:165 start_codon:yes stop_codon:yes gene_type:complete